MIRIAHPLDLLFLLALAALALLGVRLLRARGRVWAGWWPWPSVLLTCLAPALLVIALADPQVDVHRQPPTVLAVDQSASVSPAGRAVERRWIAKIADDHCISACRVVYFGATATVAPVKGAEVSKPDPTETDLQSALQSSAALLPNGGRVVVLSDGGQTTGDLLALAPAARARDISVDWVRLPAETRPDASITALSAPQSVRLGDQVPLTLTIHSDVTGAAVLSVRSGTSQPREQTVHLQPGDNPVLLFYTAQHRGWQSFETLVSLPHDVQPRNNAAYVVTDVLAAPRVLTIQGTGSGLARVLAASGLNERTASPSALPDVASGYRGLDSVVLDDVDAHQLSKTQISVLRTAVRSRGVGLMVSGGPHSLSLGHYAKSGLQGLLPVNSLVPGNLQRRNVAIELVLDHSGSMIDEAGGVPKIEMTRQAAADSAGFIAAHKDELGVVDFDIAAHILVPLQALSTKATQKSVVKSVEGLQANGGTNIYLGLKAGYNQLIKSSAPERHIILMTDGISQPADYAPLLAKLHNAHISVATVALGSSADRSLLAKIATATGGHIYVTDDAKHLPEIFAKETQLAAKPVKVKGKVTVSANGDSTLLRSLIGTTLPGLTGNVVTQLNPGAQADLVTSNAKKGTDPALAEWQIGAGRVVVWTPGFGAPWAQAWDGERQFFNDAVRWVQSPTSLSTFVPQAPPGVTGVLQIDLGPAGSAELGISGITGTLTDQGNYSFPVTFRSVGASLFQANVSSFPAGVYRFQLTTQGNPARTFSGAVAIPSPAEYSPATSEASPLPQLVAETSGLVLGPAQKHRIAVTTGSLRRLLELLALLVFLAGVVQRVAPGLIRRWRGPRSAAKPPTDWQADDQPEWGISSDSERPLSNSSVSPSTDVGAGT